MNITQYGVSLHVGYAFVLSAVLLFSTMAFAASPVVETGSADRAALAEKNMRKFLGEADSSLSSTDPDFAAMRDRLLYGEIAEHGTLTDKQRALITLVVLTSSQTLDDLKSQVSAALRVGATPVEIKEAMY